MHEHYIVNINIYASSDIFHKKKKFSCYYLKKQKRTKYVLEVCPRITS